MAGQGWVWNSIHTPVPLASSCITAGSGGRNVRRCRQFCFGMTWRLPIFKADIHGPRYFPGDRALLHRSAAQRCAWPPCIHRRRIKACLRAPASPAAPAIRLHAGVQWQRRQRHIRCTADVAFVLKVGNSARFLALSLADGKPSVPDLCDHAGCLPFHYFHLIQFYSPTGICHCRCSKCATWI